MANTRKQLEQAFKLIEEEKLDKAIGILRPIVKKEPDNAEAWWMMANAVSEPEEAHNALENVLRLNPNHPQARELLDTLRQEYPGLGGTGQSDFGDTDLSFDDLFQQGAPTPATPAASPAADLFDSGFDAAPVGSDQSFGDADDVFGSNPSFDSGFDAAPVGSDQSFDSGNIDDLFGNTSTASGSFSNQSKEDLFTTPTFDDTQFSSFEDQFSSSEPAFIQDDTLGMDAAAKPERGKAEAKPKKEKKPKEPKPAKTPNLAQPDAQLDPLEVEARANRRFNPAALIVPLLLLVVLIGGGLFAGIATGIINTKGPAVSPEMQTAMTNIKGQLDSAGFQKATLGVVNDTPLGSAFMVQFCDTAGRQLQERINQALDMAATGASAGRTQVKAAGVDVTSCANQNTRLFRAYVPVDKATAYVDGGMKDKRGFRANLLRN